MLKINLSQIKNLPQKAKLFSLLVLGVVFFILFSVFIYFNYFADTIIKYAPSQAVFYAHFSLPETKHSVGFENLLLSVLAQNNLADLKLSQIKREVAIVGLPQGDAIKFYVLVRTDDSKSWQSFLAGKKIAYSMLENNLILLPADSGSAVFQKNQKNSVIQESRGRFSMFNSLNVFIRPDFFAKFKDDQLVFLAGQLLADQKGNVVFGSKVVQGGVRVILPSLKNSGKINSDLVRDFDLALAVNNPAKIVSAWEKQIQADLLVDYLVLERYLKILGNKFNLAWPVGSLARLLGGQMVFLLKENGESADFFLAFETNELSETEKTDLELALKLAMARNYPKERKIRLSDNTIVTELVADPGQFEFVDINGVKTLTSPDKKQVFAYKTENGWLKITNQSRFLEFNPADFSGSGLKINTKLIYGSIFSQYLKNFDSLEIFSNKILLK